MGNAQPLETTTYFLRGKGAPAFVPLLKYNVFIEKRVRLSVRYLTLSKLYIYLQLGLQQISLHCSFLFVVLLLASSSRVVNIFICFFLNLARAHFLHFPLDVQECGEVRYPNSCFCTFSCGVAMAPYAPLHRALARGGSLVLTGLLLLVSNTQAGPTGRLHGKVQGITRGHPQQQQQYTVPVRVQGSPGQVYFRLSAFGRVFVLRLAPDASFLAPGLRVEYLRDGRGGGTAGSREVSDGLRGCFYSGTVNGRRESLAAVSLCQGVRGSFVVDGEEYLIQPAAHGKHHLTGALLGRRPGQAERAWGSGRMENHLAPHLLRRRGRPSPGGHPDPDIGTLRADIHAPGPVDSATEEDWAPTAGTHSEPARRRRFVSEARSVETLLVADASMVRFYGKELQVRRPSWRPGE